MERFRPVWAEVDLEAVAANVRPLGALVAPAALCAVVKADGYGHGAVAVSQAALEAGADCLAVALVEEGVQLREAGIDAPILVLSEPVPAAAETVVAHGLTPVVYTPAGIDALAKAVVTHGAHDPLPVHLKVDTGMHRVGLRARRRRWSSPTHVVERAELRLAGVCTHFAVADEPGNEYTDDATPHLRRRVRRDPRRRDSPTGVVHACNTAGAIAVPDARYDMVRVGIGIYGLAPAPALAGRVELGPALSVKAQRLARAVTARGRAALVRPALRRRRARRASRPSRSVTPTACRASLSHHGGEVLIGGRRHPIAGTVTMDQLMVDVGDDAVEVGDEVVLIGRQGDEQITADEWAERMDTIAYTIVCGVGPRVPRRYLVSLAKRVGIAAGTLGGVGRTRVRRPARRRDADAPRARRRRGAARSKPPRTSIIGSTRTTAARIYVVERGNELDPPIVLSHGVTLSVRTWFHQLEDAPEGGLPHDRVRPPRSRASRCSANEGHSLDNLGRDFKTVLEGLDLRGAVLVGHSMGGVAVQSFVTQLSRGRGRTRRRASCCSRRSRTRRSGRARPARRRGIEKISKRTPDSQWLWDSPNLGFLAARVGFGEHPHPSHVELVRQMMGECPPETRRPRRRVLVGLDLTAELPNVRIPTLVIGGTADVLTPPFEARRMAAAHPGRPARADAGRRAHADARTHRTSSTGSSSTSPASRATRAGATDPARDD